MRYLSTRGGQGTGLVDAVMRGLAADGGLFVPDELPRLDASAVHGESFAEIAAEVSRRSSMAAGDGARTHLSRCVQFPAAAERARTEW
jgi:threonine synthase